MHFQFLLLQADTTSTGYKVGYHIGAWLPFMLLAGITFLIIKNRWPKKK